MSVKAITSKQEFDALLNSGKVVFIDFYANWCGPCKQISPFFEELAKKKTQEDVEFYKVNIDDVPDVANELGIRSIPTFHAYKNQERLDVVVGANRNGLENLINAGITRL